MKLIRLSIIIIILCCAGGLKAQDIHFSLFHMSPLTLNPAHTGAFEGTARVGGIYRDQWGSFLDNQFKTPVFYIDAPIIRGLKKNHWVGIGMTTISDKVGPSAGADKPKDERTTLQTNANLFSVAYHMGLGDGFDNVLTIGVQGGTLKRELMGNEFTFEDQLATNIGGGGLGVSVDGASLQTSGKGQFDLNAGVMLRTVLSEQARLEIGGAVSHITKPNYSLLSGVGSGGPGGGNNNVADEDKRPMTISAHGRVRYAFSETLSITPGFLWQSTSGANEIALQSWLGYKVNDQYSLSGGLAYRFGDSAEILAGVDFMEGLRVALSYDINLSALNTATNYSGGFELSAYYIFKLYKNPDVKPAILCPKF